MAQVAVLARPCSVCFRINERIQKEREIDSENKLCSCNFLQLATLILVPAPGRTSKVPNSTWFVLHPACRAAAGISVQLAEWALHALLWP